MESTEYIPGMCNINRAEISYRKKAMIFGYAIAIFIFVIAWSLGLNGWIRAVLVFVPLYVGVIGSFQVRNRFCVSYGASGKQNAADGNTDALDVSDDGAKQADKQKARRMNLQAFAITLAVLALTLFIPSV